MKTGYSIFRQFFCGFSELGLFKFLQHGWLLWLIHVVMAYHTSG